MAQEHKHVTVSPAAQACDGLWVRFPLEEIEYFISSFARSGTEAKRGVELHHLTRIAFRIRRKMGNGSVLIGTECLNTRYPDLNIFRS